MRDILINIKGWLIILTHNWRVELVEYEGDVEDKSCYNEGTGIQVLYLWGVDYWRHYQVSRYHQHQNRNDNWHLKPTNHKVVINCSVHVLAVALTLQGSKP